MLIRTFTISNFRTFDYLEFGNLERVNLVGGMNNVGKTALLEALWQFASRNLPRTGLQLNDLRGIREPDAEDLSFHLFHRYDTSVPIELIADGDWGAVPRSLSIKIRPRATSRISLGEDDDSSEYLVLDEYPDEIVFQYVDEEGEQESTGWLERRRIGPDRWQTRLSSSPPPQPQSTQNQSQSQYFSARFRNTSLKDADRLSRMEIRGLEDSLLDSLIAFEPNLSRLTVLSIGGRPVVHANVGLPRLIPVGLLGDGMQRIISLALAFESATGGLILIDEIENGIHYSKLPDLWQVISSFSQKYNTQVFATTHSRECARAAHKVFSGTEDYDFTYQRLDRVGEKIKVKRFDKAVFETALDGNFEIR